MNYVITVRVNGDPKYQANPLIANLDIRVKDPNDILSDNPALLNAIVAGMVIAAIVSISYLKRQIATRKLTRGK